MRLPCHPRSTFHLGLRRDPVRWPCSAEWPGWCSGPWSTQPHESVNRPAISTRDCFGVTTINPSQGLAVLVPTKPEASSERTPRPQAREFDCLPAFTKSTRVTACSEYSEHTTGYRKLSLAQTIGTGAHLGPLLPNRPC